MVTASRFTALFSAFACMAPIQFFLLLVQLYVLSSLVDWFLVLLPSIFAVALLMMQGVVRLCQPDRSNSVLAFDVLFFSVSGSTLLTFFLLLARHLNGNSDSSSWIVVFVPLMVLALALFGFQTLDGLSCKRVPLRDLGHIWRRRDEGVHNNIYGPKRPSGSQRCQRLLLIFWLILIILSVSLPLAAEWLISWSLVFLFAYLGLFVLLLYMVAAAGEGQSSANVIAGKSTWLLLLATVIAFHVHAAVGESEFPASYILGGLLVATAIALFAIWYIRWQRRRPIRASQQNI